MIEIASRALAAVFVLISIAGTAASGLVLGQAFDAAGTRASPYAPSVGTCLMMIAMTVEGLRLALSVNAESVWRHSRFQGVAFALPLWLACTAYAIVVPLLAVIVGIPPGTGVTRALAALVAAWVVVQLIAGLLPGVRWRTASRDAASHELPQVANGHRRPARMPAPPASTADDLLKVITGLAELPEGSSLPGRGYIAANREVVLSQASLAGLIGRPKPTVRRWLQQLERSGRITTSASGKITSIRLAFANTPAPNGHGAD